MGSYFYIHVSSLLNFDANNVVSFDIKYFFRYYLIQNTLSPKHAFVNCFLLYWDKMISCWPEVSIQ